MGRHRGAAARCTGEEEALAALTLRYVPYDAAASAPVAETTRDELARLTPEVLERWERGKRTGDD